MPSSSESTSRAKASQSQSSHNPISNDLSKPHSPKNIYCLKSHQNQKHDVNKNKNNSPGSGSVGSNAPHPHTTNPNNKLYYARPTATLPHNPNHNHNKQQMFLTDTQTSDHTKESHDNQTSSVPLSIVVKKLKKENQSLKKQLLSAKTSEFFHVDESKIKLLLEENENLKKELRVMKQSLEESLIERDFLEKFNQNLKSQCEKLTREIVAVAHNNSNSCGQPQSMDSRGNTPRSTTKKQSHQKGRYLGLGSSKSPRPDPSVDFELDTELLTNSRDVVNECSSPRMSMKPNKISERMGNCQVDFQDNNRCERFSIRQLEEINGGNGNGNGNGNSARNSHSHSHSKSVRKAIHSIGGNDGLQMQKNSGSKQIAGMKSHKGVTGDKKMVKKVRSTSRIKDNEYFLGKGLKESKDVRSGKKNMKTQRRQDDY